ncbi:deoxycytidine deaminase [Mycoplasmatota bacterium WC44]
MILTGKEIISQVRLGNITIKPFNAENVNPNSVNYTLGDKIVLLPNGSVNKTSEIVEINISKKGYLLKANQVYLGVTNEIIGSEKYVTSLIGRSSIGRLGLFLQLSADLGNLGNAHRWTLELACVQPIYIYPNMKIGQVSFWQPEGKHENYSSGYSLYNVPHTCEDNKLRVRYNDINRERD